MDSLRNLRTSLPRTSPASGSPHELLNAFKAAALSVTNLYKTAATEQARTRAAGYQDALDDLLTFLDLENLGLGVDGEGWRVRQWATERYHGTAGGHSDDEDEREEQQQEPVTRQESPEVHRKQEQHEQTNDPSSPSATRQEEDVKVEAVPIAHNNPDMSTFRSSLPYPSGNHDRDTEMDAPSLPSDHASATASGTQQQHSSPVALNLGSRQRSNRNIHRHTSNGNNRSTSFNNNNNNNNNTTTSSLGVGAGSKRRMPDFFDISGFGGFGGSPFGGNPSNKDFDRSGGGGGKRTRHA
ncbi:hypothetical protein AAFC00_000926 [Neodothiora populina]|uniref:Uncharacterized protein n=1 Tax=Neodothiora populina TaxID=2781224 RepID=A0ABR3PN84_9PEZI